jgi:hypothetical protein
MKVSLLGYWLLRRVFLLAAKLFGTAIRIGVVVAAVET